MAMRVLIYGAGAVGLGIASCLIRTDVATALIARPATCAALREHGILRTGIFGEATARPEEFTVADSLDALDFPSPDFVLVCCKSFDSEASAADLARHSEKIRNAKIILFQNGWGNRDFFDAAFPGQHIYTARVITGFRRPQPNHTDITVHADAVQVGSLDPIPLSELESELGALCAHIDRGGLPCKVSPAVVKDLWAKILYNCALNPLGAIFGVPYGALAEHTPGRDLMNTIFDEIFAVMNAEGLQTHWPDSASYQVAFYGNLVPTTAAHESSMLQALRAGARIEIDSLSGAIVALGRKHGIPTPVNETMLRMIKYLEERGRKK